MCVCLHMRIHGVACIYAHVKICVCACLLVQWYNMQTKLKGHNITYTLEVQDQTKNGL